MFTLVTLSLFLGVCLKVSAWDFTNKEDVKKYIVYVSEHENVPAPLALAIAKAEREARLDNEMREVLKGCTATPFDLDKDVVQFRKMKMDTPELFERTMAILKATDAQLAQSKLFEDFGTRKGSGEGSAWAQIEAKADQMVEKMGDKLTREQAIEKVMLANPKLVKQYRQEAQ